MEETFLKIQKSIKDLIFAGKIESAINALRLCFIDGDHRREELDRLESRYKSNIRQSRKENTEIELNKVKDSIFDIIENNFPKTIDEYKINDIQLLIKNSGRSIDLNNVPNKPFKFIGRSTELDEIHDLLFNKKRISITGIGGIGKTSLAAAYVEKFRKSFDYILWLNLPEADNPILPAIRSDLATICLQLNISILNEELESSILLKIINHLKSVQENVLIVLNNTTSSIYQDQYHDSLLSFSFVLSTSRFRLGEKYEIYELQKLNEESAQELFLKHYPKGNDQVEMIKKILNFIDCHPLMIELLGKSLNVHSHLTVSNLYSILLEKKFDLVAADVFTDHSQKQIQVYSYVLQVFDLSNLDDNELKILRYFSLLTSEELSLSNLFLLFGFYKDDLKILLSSILHKLYEKGWINKIEDNHETLFTCHSVIKEIAGYSSKPDSENCRCLLDHFHELFTPEDSPVKLIQKESLIPYAFEMLRILEPEEINLYQGSLRQKIGTVQHIVYNSNLNFYRSIHAFEKDVLIYFEIVPNINSIFNQHYSNYLNGLKTSLEDPRYLEDSPEYRRHKELILAKLHFILSDFSKAYELYSQYLAQNYDYELGFLNSNIAVCLYHLERESDSEQHLEKAISYIENMSSSETKEIDKSTIMFNKAFLLYNKGEINESLEILKNLKLNLKNKPISGYSISIYNVENLINKINPNPSLS